MGIVGFKGFDKDFKYRDKQYEVGKTFEESEVSVCSKGMHFCENPMDVFNYYAPGTSRYAEVEGLGENQKHDDDSKVATSKLHIKDEININSLVNAGVKFVLDRVNWKDAKESNTGDHSAASVEGKESVAIATGFESRAKGALGCWIVLAEGEETRDGYHIKDVQSMKVDGENIKADVWYVLKNGEFAEWES